MRSSDKLRYPTIRYQRERWYHDAMARRPATPPLGLALARTARVVTTASARALAGAGGPAAVWQVLLLVRSGESGTQSRMAEAMGVTAATLTHHLNALEAQGLVRRRRDEVNRRVQRVELTDEGAALFDRLRRGGGPPAQRPRSPPTPPRTGPPP